MKYGSFLTSCLLAFIGGHVINYSIIFLFIEKFQSPGLAGVGFALCFGPPLILGWFAGYYCDRYSPKNVILIAQNSFLVSLILLFTSQYQGDSLEIPLILIAAFLAGVGWSFVAPARFAAVARSIPADRLSKATIHLNLMVMTGFGLAPIFLQQLKYFGGWTLVFSAAGLLFIASALLLLPVPMARSGIQPKFEWRELTKSIGEIRQSRHLSQLLIMAVVTYLLMGPMQVLLPPLTRQLLGLSELTQGYYLSLVAFSLIIGGIASLKLRSYSTVGKQILISVGVSGVGIFLLSFTSIISVSAVILIVAATSGGIAISLIVAGIQNHAHGAYQGRIMSIYTIVSQVIPAASGLLSGLMAEWLSVGEVMAISGVAIILMSLIAAARFATLRKMETLSYV